MSKRPKWGAPPEPPKKTLREILEERAASKKKALGHLGALAPIFAPKSSPESPLMSNGMPAPPSTLLDKLTNVLNSLRECGYLGFHLRVRLVRINFDERLPMLVTVDANDVIDTAHRVGEMIVAETGAAETLVFVVETDPGTPGCVVFNLDIPLPVRSAHVETLH